MEAIWPPQWWIGLINERCIQKKCQVCLWFYIFWISPGKSLSNYNSTNSFDAHIDVPVSLNMVKWRGMHINKNKKICKIRRFWGARKFHDFFYFSKRWGEQCAVYVDTKTIAVTVDTCAHAHSMTSSNNNNLRRHRCEYPLFNWKLLEHFFCGPLCGLFEIGWVEMIGCEYDIILGAVQKWRHRGEGEGVRQIGD